MFRWIVLTGQKLTNYFNNLSISIKIPLLLMLIFTPILIMNYLFTIDVVQEHLEESIIQSKQNSLEQLAGNINDHLSNAMYYFVTLERTVSNSAYMEAITRQPALLAYYQAQRRLEYQSVYTGMLAQNDNYDYIHSAIVLSEKGETWAYSHWNTVTLRRDILEIVDFDKLGTGYTWGPVMDQSYYFVEPGQSIVSVASGIQGIAGRYIVIFNLNVEQFTRKISELSGGTKDNILIDIGMNSIIDSDFDSELLEQNRYKELIAGMDDGGKQQDGYLVLGSEMRTSGWRLYMFSRQENLGERLYVVRQVLFQTFLAIVLMFFLITALITYIVSKPLKGLTRIMKNVTKINGEIQFHAKYSDEVGSLASTYNTMMTKLNKQADKIQEQEQQNYLATLQLLQMQIKPHFLYNSLESVKYLVSMGDSASVALINAICQFFKLSLNGVSDRSTIGEEYEQLRHYLFIQRSRYSSRLDFEMYAEEEILPCELVKFTLQPLVENAIYHGIKQKRSKGIIRITSSRQGDDVLIRVWDNGAGIPRETLEELRTKLRLASIQSLAVTDGIGLVNVHYRLKLRYGAQYGLFLDSVPGEFTSVDVRIPWQGTPAGNKEV